MSGGGDRPVAPRRRSPPTPAVPDRNQETTERARSRRASRAGPPTVRIDAGLVGVITTTSTAFSPVRNAVSGTIADQRPSCPRIGTFQGSVTASTVPLTATARATGGWPFPRPVTRPVTCTGTKPEAGSTSRNRSAWSSVTSTPAVSPRPRRSPPPELGRRPADQRAVRAAHVQVRIPGSRAEQRVPAPGRVPHRLGEPGEGHGLRVREPVDPGGPLALPRRRLEDGSPVHRPRQPGLDEVRHARQDVDRLGRPVVDPALAAGTAP